MLPQFVTQILLCSSNTDSMPHRKFINLSASANEKCKANADIRVNNENSVENFDLTLKY